MSGFSRIALALLVVLLGSAACGSVDPQASNDLTLGARPGGRILFAQNGDIFLWDGDVRQITRLGDASSPSWAGDGNRFVFVRSGDAMSDLYAGVIGGDKYQQLTFNKPNLQPGSKDYVDNAVWALDPSWSPVADTIAFASDRTSAKNFIWIIRGLGNNPTQVAASTINGDNAENPRFSPDGTKLLFTQRMTDENNTRRRTGIWVVDLNTGVLNPVASGEEGSYDATWSPDGKWIAFIQRSGEQNDLWVVPAAGGQPTRLTEGRSLVSPVWSPDGTAVAFLELDGSTFRVSYVTVSTGPGGSLTASKPEKLFSAGQIDAPSGLSWVK